MHGGVVAAVRRSKSRKSSRAAEAPELTFGDVEVQERATRKSGLVRDDGAIVRGARLCLGRAGHHLGGKHRLGLPEPVRVCREGERERKAIVGLFREPPLPCVTGNGLTEEAHRIFDVASRESEPAAKGHAPHAIDTCVVLVRSCERERGGGVPLLSRSIRFAKPCRATCRHERQAHRCGSSRTDANRRFASLERNPNEAIARR